MQNLFGMNFVLNNYGFGTSQQTIEKVEKELGVKVSYLDDRIVFCVMCDPLKNEFYKIKSYFELIAKRLTDDFVCYVIWQTKFKSTSLYCIDCDQAVYSYVTFLLEIEKKQEPVEIKEIKLDV